MLAEADVIDLVTKRLFPKFKAELKNLDVIDKWARWDHDKPHRPRQSSNEYKELIERSQVPYLGLVVTGLVQSMYVDGYRRADDPEDAAPWHYWQVNGMDKRQVALHRATATYGIAYATVLPGKTFTGEPIPVIRGKSPRRFMAFYDDPVDDDWPLYALRADPMKQGKSSGWDLRVYDDANVYLLTCDSGGTGVKIAAEPQVHAVGVCPVVRYTNLFDLEGRADGEVEALIPVQARIDQTIFDRLVVQRFASWIVRTIAGMESPAGAKDPKNPTNEEIAAAKLRLKVEDILVAADPDTKFGSLPATPLDGFISAHDSDLRDLVAVSQTAPHHLLGQLVNLSAEALAAAETGSDRKQLERKMSTGESHEQTLRLGAHIMGDTESANDMEAQVRWRDVGSRSLAQTADALGKIATMLGFPVELLWEKIPNMTQQDIAAAKAIVAENGGITALMQHLSDGTTPAADPEAPPVAA